MNRRKFLKNSFLGLGAFSSYHFLDLFLQTVCNGMLNRAYAIEENVDLSYLEKKFVNISLTGAPAAWIWNLPLKPSASDPFFYNGNNEPKTSMLWTKFVSDPSMPSGLSGVYHTTQIGQYSMPYLWSADIPTPSGGRVPMSNLANHGFFGRGIKCLDNHEISRFMQVHPTSGPSLGGILSDQSNTTLPSVGFGAEPSFFKSAKGVNQHQVSYTSNQTPFDLTFSSFATSSTLQATNGVIGEKIDSVLERMKNQSSVKHGLLPSAFAQRLNAKKLMLNQFNQLRESYYQLVLKYSSLIEKVLRDPSFGLQGVHDQVVSSGLLSPDSRMRFSIPSTYTGQNMQSIFATATMPYLAEQMALCEFLLTGSSVNLCFSSSINLRVYEFMNNLVADRLLVGGVSKTNESFSLGADSHYLGVYGHLLYFTRYYHALAAVIYELIHVLKSKQIGNGNLFDQTVIAVTSEFSRIPDVNEIQLGSHHGTSAGYYTIFSGMISSLMIGGDINSNPSWSGTLRPGSFGDGANSPYFDNLTPVLGNAVSTVASMLDIESPTPNSKSFLIKNKSTGKMSLACPSATNKT